MKKADTQALAIRTRRSIKFARIEREDSFAVFAFVIEQNGNETIILSEPRLIRIIPKASSHRARLMLAGSVSRAGGLLALAGDIASLAVQRISASFSYPFAFAAQESFSAGLYARPPTL